MADTCYIDLSCVGSSCLRCYVAVWFVCWITLDTTRTSRFETEKYQKIIVVLHKVFVHIAVAREDYCCSAQSVCLHCSCQNAAF